MYFFPLIIFAIVANSLVIQVESKKVPTADSDSLCSLEGEDDDERTRVEFYDDGQGIFWIKVCACKSDSSVDDLSGVTVAESENLCHSSNVQLLEWDRNATIDRRCLLTKPLNFDPHGHYPAKLVFCPSSLTIEGLRLLWNKEIPVHQGHQQRRRLPTPTTAAEA